MTQKEISTGSVDTLIPKLVCASAAILLKHPVSEKTALNWKKLVLLIDGIDNEYDQARPDQRAGIKDAALELINQGSGKYTDNPLARSVRDAIPENLRTNFSRDLESQFRITDQVLITSDPKEYARKTAEDGQTAALFFKYFLPDSDLRNSGKIRVFDAVLQKAGGIVKIVDSIFDLEKDITTNHLQITNIPETQKYLKRELIRQLVPAWFYSLPSDSQP